MIVENSLDDFANRFIELQREAQRYGIACLSVLLDDDPIRQEEEKRILYTHGHMVSVGMAEYARYCLLARTPSELEEEEEEE